MRTKNEIRYLLINTPLTDPTVPYHSIPYLVGATSKAGFTNFSCLDANIESLNKISQQEEIEELIRYCEDICLSLEKKNILNRWEQLLYRCAVRSFGLSYEHIQKAINVLKDPLLFYDYTIYRQAVMVLKRWMIILSVKGFPNQFHDFSLAQNRVLNFSSIEDLTNSFILNTLTNPFSSYFKGPFHKIIDDEWDLIGLSVNYQSQLPFCIYLSKLIKSICPRCIVCIGGTEITDVIKYITDKHLIWKLFENCDVIVMGEGETALTEILESIRLKNPLPHQCPGVLIKGDPIIFDDFKLQIHITYENLSNLPSPRYDIWKWSEYWSPEPIILYSPTRGCYWNQCTFCDYGLNTSSPTSPSRQKPILEAIEEIHEITKIGRTLYFAVDAMSPAYLKKLSSAIIENGISISWSAELRLERLFQTSLAEGLKKAGCVSISFGYESGSQRILDLINKGIKIDNVPSVLKELSHTGIGVQMMGFIGFPSEKPEEAFETFNFLEKNMDYWILAGIGDFVLTSGSIVAKKPHDFGIDTTLNYNNDDIARTNHWIENDKIIIPGNMRSPKINYIADSLVRVADDRPFVGGIDSSHSILYFSKFGKRLLPSLYNTNGYKIIEQSYYRTPFKVDSFIQEEDLRNYHIQQLSKGRSTESNEILKWLSEFDHEQSLYQDGGNLLEIYPSGHFINLTNDEIKYQENPSYRKIKEIILHSCGII